MTTGEESASSTAAEKQLAAEAAAALPEAGMIVGLGTGSTVAYLLPALAARRLDIRCVATSPATASAAKALGMLVEPFQRIERIDLTIDGADQVDPDGWLIKGGGGAHTREKIVAAASDRFVVIVSSEKLLDRLRPPVPLELLDFGLAATLHLLGDVRIRDAPRSPDNGIIADLVTSLDDLEAVAGRLSATPGVVDHGLCHPAMVSEVLVGEAGSVQRRVIRH